MAAKKWRENDFWQNIADDTVYTLRVKNFVEMAVLHHLRDKRVFNIFHNCKIQKIAITHLAIEVHLYNRYHLVGTEKVAQQHIFAKCSKCIFNE